MTEGHEELPEAHEDDIDSDDDCSKEVGATLQEFLVPQRNTHFLRLIDSADLGPLICQKWPKVFVIQLLLIFKTYSRNISIPCLFYLFISLFNPMLRCFACKGYPRTNAFFIFHTLSPNFKKLFEYR